HHYPHPNTFHKLDVKDVHRFYVIVVGQEVGIFFDCGATYKKHATFQEAFEHYCRAYACGELRAVPTPGGMF
ncbi:hypothetical protein BDN67DRAFT_859466, partial [Paxillus ammoniavirescens]